MCGICEKCSKSAKYTELVKKSIFEDEAKLESTKKLGSGSDLIKCFSDGETVEAGLPMFEARTAYSVPQNYFQQVSINSEKLGNMFSHGSTRSVFFKNGKMRLLSKHSGMKEGMELFTSYLWVGFEPGEFSVSWEGNKFTINANHRKTLKNLVTGNTEEIEVSFNFIGEDVKNRIVSKEQILSSSQVQSVYSKYGASARMASVDLHGYGVTVPHFSPHPYMLLAKEELGFGTNREMQEKTVDYFRAHLR